MKKSILFLLVSFGFGADLSNLKEDKSMDEKTLDVIENTKEDSMQENLPSNKISQKSIERYVVTSTTQIQKILPSLRIYAQGSDTFPMVSYRGVSSPDFYSSVLGVYVDGVPQAPNFLIQNLSDLQSIELISGALGILYGENAPLGLIDIRTKNPMHGNYVDVDVMGGNLQERVSVDAGGALLKNKVWGKMNVQYLHDNGYIRYPTNKKPLNSADGVMVGGSLYYQMTHSLLLTGHYDYQYSFSRKDFFLTQAQAKNLTLTSTSLATWSDFTAGVQDKILNLTPYNLTNAHNASIKLDSDFKDWNLHLIAALQKVDTLANEYPGVYVQNEKTQGYYYNTLQAITEARLEGKHRFGLSSTMGLYYKYLLLENGMKGVDTSALGYSGNWDANERLNTMAAFGALSWRKDRFLLNFGVRYQFFHTQIISHNPPVTEITPYSNEANFHAVNPALILSYDVGENKRLYTQLSTTTKPGGFAKFPFADTDTIPYQPESLYSAQLGSDLGFLNNKLKLKLDAYYLWRENVQSYVGVGYYKSIKNIGSAYVYGLDVNLSYMWKYFQIFANANLGTSRFSKGGKNIGTITILGQTGAYDLSGLRPKFAPIFTLNSGLDLFLLNLLDHKLTSSFLVNVSSSYYLDDFARDESLIQKAYATLDVILNYTFKKQYEFILFAQNITNTRYMTTAVWDTNGRAYITNAPYFYGLRFKYHY